MINRRRLLKRIGAVMVLGVTRTKQGLAKGVTWARGADRYPGKIVDTVLDESPGSWRG
ncbi:hypothetical protein ACFL3F_03075 [Planctomycetota bacterium]